MLVHRIDLNIPHWVVSFAAQQLLLEMTYPISSDLADDLDTVEEQWIAFLRLHLTK